ncbi:hypothetical protein LTR53_009122 [Teratosphaeriaceae sp. CCFEE 6253]|nr:hypothetical protein LTR53_009122 [Teratosphaeriaceae sp. CCFEE 6253]
MASFNDVRCPVDNESVGAGQTIEVIIGVEGRVFHVHEKLLCSRSAFFGAALNKEWKEGQNRKVELLQESCADFSRYVHWLYSGKLAVKPSTPGQPLYDAMMALYVLGEKIIDPRFQDRVIDAIVASTRERNGTAGRLYPNMTHVTCIYKTTPEGSPARRLLVDMYAIKAGPTWFHDEKPEDIMCEFFFDLTCALMERREVTDKTRQPIAELDKGSPCSYHKHGKDETCPSKTG